MKVLILSDANSIHTYKWVESLKSNNIDLILFSFFLPGLALSNKYSKLNVKIISPNLKSKIKNLRTPNYGKLKYIKSVKLLRQVVKSFKPQIIHAHYASSYGLLGVICRLKPLFVSVWGSDIYFFPKRNFVNKLIMKYILYYPKKIFSTSHAMKKIIEDQYNRFDVEVIPFGVEPEKFKTKKIRSEKFAVGTIKSLEDHNGIDCIIKAAKIIIDEYNLDIDFIIVGGGSLLEEMKNKTKNLKLSKNITFTGYLEHEQAIKYYGEFSIFLVMSTRESFGVSVVEAAASGLPSITSNIGGLPEVNINNNTGFVISPGDYKSLAKLIKQLYYDNNLRYELGKNARKHALKNFNWKENVNLMLKEYHKV